MPSAIADVRVVKWGNSQGIRIPRAVFEAAGLHLGEEVTLRVENQSIIVSPVAPQPRYKRAGHRCLEEVFTEYDGEPQGEEWLRGRLGKEALYD